MKIRREHHTDIAEVRQVHLRAFGDHGAKVAGLNDDLRTAAVEGIGLSLVAVQDAVVVGHVMFSHSLLDAAPRLVDVRTLSPIGVVPEYQRKGVGSALIRHGVDILATRHVPLVFLEGDPAYYSKLGFEPATECGFRKPSLRIPDPAFQVMRLPSYEPWMTGTFVYRDTFWNHDAVGLRDS